MKAHLKAFLATIAIAIPILVPVLLIIKYDDIRYFLIYPVYIFLAFMYAMYSSFLDDFKGIW